MKKTSVIACLVLTIAAATSIRAHHSFSMFDASKEEVVVGDVVRWAFNSPHTVLYLRDAKGTAWGFEGAAPPALVGRNPKIDGFTFKPGDRVTMIHCPLGDGRNGGAIGLVVTKDGTGTTPPTADAVPVRVRTIGRSGSRPATRRRPRRRARRRSSAAKPAPNLSCTAQDGPSTKAPSTKDQIQRS